MEKISRQHGKDWVDCSYEPVFEVKTMGAGVKRIVASVSSRIPEAFERLIATLEEPYLLLYVLHTPRGEGEPGRYQSEELSKEEVSRFLHEFADYLFADARFDLWVYSPAEKSTVVWDRHNLIYAYGPIPRYERALLEIGYGQAVAMIPAPHAHNYRQVFDQDASRLLHRYSWSFSPLRPEDEQ